MKKIIAAIILCGCFALTACEKSGTEKTRKIPSVNISDAVSSKSTDESSFSTETIVYSEPDFSEITMPQPTLEPPSVEPPSENGSNGYHDMSNGNTLYNPNVTDKSNTARYYADFEWKSDPRALWTSSIDEVPWAGYDPDAAVEYGFEHWNDGMGLCAAFLSRCLKAGGIINYSESSTALTLQLLHSRLGFGQFLAFDKDDKTITLPEYARPGDVVQIYCSFEGCVIHSTLMVGTDEDGKLKAVCHNLANSGESAYLVDSLNDPCLYCDSETAEIFFYHFYRDDDENLPSAVLQDKKILLWEENAYIIPGESYDREAALDYARRNHKDGIGYKGAMHTSEILKAGGLSVGYPNQSALFLQLLKSHLGEARSQSIRSDRTVTLPVYAKAGDVGFVYCPKDGIITSSFIISGKDSAGRMTALSYDLVNDGKSAFRIEDECVGCGTALSEVIIYCFDN